MGETRTETDFIGTIEVPVDKFWGAQTQRALLNFQIGEERNCGGGTTDNRL